MNAQGKNQLIAVAKGMMDSAIALVVAEVYSGLLNAPSLLSGAANLINATGDAQDAQQAGQRAGECGPILAIPWPFIYAGSTAWIAAVARLRDSLPTFIDLQPADRMASEAARAQAAARDQEARIADVQKRWDALTDAQRGALTAAGVNVELLRTLAH